VVEPALQAFEMQEIKEFDLHNLAQGGLLMTHSQKKDTFESVLGFEDADDFRVAEYSHVRSDSGFEIRYEAEDSRRTYPIYVNMTMIGSNRMAYEVNSEKDHLEEIECTNRLSIKNYWQAKIMLAFSCD